MALAASSRLRQPVAETVVVAFFLLEPPPEPVLLSPEPLPDWMGAVVVIGGSEWPSSLLLAGVVVTGVVVTGVVVTGGVAVGAGPLSCTGCSSFGLLVGLGVLFVSLPVVAGGIATAVAPVSLDCVGVAGGAGADGV